MMQGFQGLKNFLARCNSSFFSGDLIEKLDGAEKKPVLFIKGKKDIRFEPIFNEAKKRIEADDRNEQLQQRWVALQYRLESSNGGIDPTPFQQEAMDFLYLQAIHWKHSHPHIGKAICSAKELMHIKKAAHYPEFVVLLKQFSPLKEKFLNWILQDGNEVVPFIEFPASCERIIASKLSGRINRQGVSALEVAKETGSQEEEKIKTLCLPFEGRFLSILDEDHKITFRGNYTLSIREIFNIFSQKDVEVGNLEFMREGIVNWNIHRLGYWNANLNQYITIDMSQDKWWEQMPVLEILNRRQLVKRFGMDIKSHGWIAAAVATRTSLDLDYDATHAFLEVAIPNQNDTYTIYDFGKLATEYPSNLLERLMMLTKTVHAAVAYPDDNVFYTTRQKGFEPFPLNSRQGRALMDLIRQDINTAQKNNFIYQIESENCAKWVHLLLTSVLEEKNVPDLFRMQLLDTHPKGVVSHIFSWIKKLPDSWQIPVLTFLHLPLGASRTIWIEEEGQQVAKSLSRHSFFETGQIFLPALLVHKVMSAKVASHFSASKYFVRKQKLCKINRSFVKIFLHVIYFLSFRRKYVHSSFCCKQSS